MTPKSNKSKYDGYTQRITDWNFNTGIITHKEFNPINEIGNVLEELLESLGIRISDKEKIIIRNKLKLAKKRGAFLNKENFEDYSLDDLAEILDGCGDAIVILQGYMSFILYLAGFEQKAIGPKIVEIMNIIMTHNELKRFKYDETIGKLVKDKDFDKINHKTLPQMIIKNLLVSHSQRLMKKERNMATKKTTESTKATKKPVVKKEAPKKASVKKEASKKASKPAADSKKKTASKKTK